MKHYSTRTLAGFELHVAVQDSKNTADIYLTTPSQPETVQQELRKGLEAAKIQYVTMNHLPGVLLLSSIRIPETKEIRVGEGESAAMMDEPLTDREKYEAMSQAIAAMLKEFDAKVAVGGFKAGFLGKHPSESRPSRLEQIDAFLKNEVFELGQAEKVKAKSVTQKHCSIVA